MFVIAGVTGHVGSVVAEDLLAQGQEGQSDRARRRQGERVVGRRAPSSPSVRSTIRRSSTGALRGATGFFTLLPPDYTATDIFASQKKLADAIASAVKASGVPHVVMLSSIGADLETGTGPVKGLHYLEEALEATGVRLTATSRRHVPGERRELAHRRRATPASTPTSASRRSFRCR